MPDIKFKEGVLRLDLNSKESKQTAIFLAFNPYNADHRKYDAIYNAIPIIHGLKRKNKRMEFAFDIVEALDKNGIQIIKKGQK